MSRVRTAILIDDDQDDLDLLKEAIYARDPSMKCICFVYPNEAIRVISEELIVVPHFVFLDINMPRMRADECIKILRNLREFDDTIITVLSTSVPPDAQKVMKELGANHVFQKPNKFDGYDKILSTVVLD
jgi:CheY-like chemotaxis protein